MMKSITTDIKIAPLMRSITPDIKARNHALMLPLYRIDKLIARTESVPSWGWFFPLSSRSAEPKGKQGQLSLARMHALEVRQFRIQLLHVPVQKSFHIVQADALAAMADDIIALNIQIVSKPASVTSGSNEFSNLCVMWFTRFFASRQRNAYCCVKTVRGDSVADGVTIQ
jgi:hypothetical protein